MKSYLSLLPLVALVSSQEAPGAQIPLSPSTRSPLTLDAIPLLGFGTWNLDRSNATEAVSLAIQTGFRHIDCADAYKNEDLVGKGIADGLAKTGLSREDIWVTSKLWNDHHGTKQVEAGLAKTLSNLGLEYLDLYHMHWPVADNNKIEYKDTWAAMTLLVDLGQVHHVGVSNFSPEQLKDLLNSTSHQPSVHQMELHPYLQQSDWIKWHADHGIHVTGYSPFAGSNPTYSPGDPPQLLQNDILTKIAKKRHCTPAQVALVWGMSRGTSVIPKSSHAVRIVENFGALECVLKKHDIEKLNELSEYHHRFNNPSKSWGVDLYHGLEDFDGKHRKASW